MLCGDYEVIKILLYKQIFIYKQSCLDSS